MRKIPSSTYRLQLNAALTREFTVDGQHRSWANRKRLRAAGAEELNIEVDGIGSCA